MPTMSAPYDLASALTSAASIPRRLPSAPEQEVTRGSGAFLSRKCTPTPGDAGKRGTRSLPPRKLTICVIPGALQHAAPSAAWCCADPGPKGGDEASVEAAARRRLV